jgi:hypothetical protein
MMKSMFLPAVLLLALSVPTMADNKGNHKGHDNNHHGGVRGAPGPIVGAGLPILLIGGGIYWLVRRRNRAS